MIRGHQLEAVVEAGLAPSVRWLQDGIRAGRIPAHKLGRHWVMTDTDIEALLDASASTGKPPEAVLPSSPLSLTVTSQRRRIA